MFKKTLSFLTVCILLCIFSGSAYAYQSHYGPSELTYYDKSKAFNGYTLFSPFGVKNTFLIDMEGNLVHSWKWPDGFNVNAHAYLLENGNIIWGVETASSPSKYQEVDWDGNLVWELQDTREGYRGHHDFLKIWNKELKAHTLLMISSKDITHEQGIAAGCDPKLRDSYGSNPDGIVEMDMNGNVVWEWNIIDHLIQDVDPTKDNYVGKGKTIKDYPQKMDVNSGSGRSGDWIHANSLDYNEELDQIVINNSSNNEFYVVDHGGTFIPGDPEKSIELAAGDAGDFLFRWGNPAMHDAGKGLYCDGSTVSEGDQQLFFAHNIRWIREGLPGAGHFLIFDNGSRHLQNTHSTILEINPYDGPMKAGKYIPQMEAGYTVPTGGRNPASISSQVVWEYSSMDPCAFYARHISGAQRMPNGNTVICAGTWGQFFEVTKEGEVVWEYINPVGTEGIFKVAGSGSPTFRVHRYAPDHPTLKGRDLTPKGKLTELAAKGEFGDLIEVRPLIPMSEGRERRQRGPK